MTRRKVDSILSSSQLEQIKRILVINLAFIGDVLLSSPTVAAIKAHLPHTSVDFLTIPLTSSIAAHHPDVHEVLIYDKRGRHKGLWAAWQLAQQLRGRNYDLAICMNFASRGAILSWAAGIPLRIGYAAQQGHWLLTHSLPAIRDPAKHESENHLAVLEPLGIRAADTKLRYQIKWQDEQSMFTKLPQFIQEKPNVKRLAFCPIGSYALKSWPLDQVANLIRSLADHAECYLIGGVKEASVLNQIAQSSGGKATVLAGSLTLPELGAFLKLMDGLVTVDTGPLHLAQALEIPTVAFFGPTDPKVWGPRGKQDHVLFRPAECSPCWGQTKCQHNWCLESISTDEVLKVVLKMLR